MEKALENIEIFKKKFFLLREAYDICSNIGTKFRFDEEPYDVIPESFREIFFKELNSIETRVLGSGTFGQICGSLEVLQECILLLESFKTKVLDLYSDKTLSREQYEKIIDPVLKYFEELKKYWGGEF